MMPIERMRPEDFDAVFRLLAQSFPAGERRDAAAQRALLADSAYQIDILRAPSGGARTAAELRAIETLLHTRVYGQTLAAPV